jgi:hypothetical protein
MHDDDADAYIPADLPPMAGHLLVQGGLAYLVPPDGLLVDEDGQPASGYRVAVEVGRHGYHLDVLRYDQGALALDDTQDALDDAQVEVALVALAHVLHQRTGSWPDLADLAARMQDNLQALGCRTTRQTQQTPPT